MRAAIEALPVDFRDVIVLREMDGLSYKEIAEVTGAPIGTVMSRLARARQHLSTVLAEKKTMSCDDCPGFADAYLDNELDAASAIRFQQHLRECRECQDAFGSRQTLLSLLPWEEMRFKAPPELPA